MMVVEYHKRLCPPSLDTNWFSYEIVKAQSKIKYVPLLCFLLSGAFVTQCTYLMVNSLINVKCISFYIKKSVRKRRMKSYKSFDSIFVLLTSEFTMLRDNLKEQKKGEKKK